MSDLLNHLNETAEELRALNKDRKTFLSPLLRTDTWNKESIISVPDIFFSLNWGDSRAGTLIAPRLVAGAKHYGLDDDQRFFARDNVNGAGNSAKIEETSPEITYKFTSRGQMREIPSDIIVAKLNKNVTTSVPPHKIVTNLPFYKPLTALVTDKEGKAFWVTGQLIGTSFRYDMAAMEEKLVGGDSGNPTFVCYKEKGKYKLALLGVHYTHWGEAYMGLPEFRLEIDKQCEEWNIEKPQYLSEVPEQTVEPEPLPPGKLTDEQKLKIFDEVLLKRYSLRRDELDA